MTSPLRIPIFIQSSVAVSAVTEGLAIAYDGDIAAAGAAVMGFSDHDADIGEDFTVTSSGQSVAVAGGVIASEGLELQVGASGKLVVLDAGIAVARSTAAATADQKIAVINISH